MKKSTFYTESKSSGYDILHLNRSGKTYSLYLSYKDYDVNLYGKFAEHLARDEFDNLLNSYRKYEVYDLSNYDPDNYERFYRDSTYSEFDVDLIEINVPKKEYIVSYGVDEMETDGYDLIGNEIYSTYVSSGVFNVIISGLKARGFKEVEEFNDVLLR